MHLASAFPVVTLGIITILAIFFLVTLHNRKKHGWKEIFHREDREKINQLLGQFGEDGRSTILELLSEARKVGRLNHALQVVWRHVDNHWSNIPVEDRAVLGDAKAYQLICQIYQDIGVNPPWKK